MVKVFDRLAISSLATATSLSRESLHEMNISAIVSLGCKLENFPESIKYYHNAEVRDECDQYMVELWMNLFQSLLKDNNDTSNLLIHCIYGQSRSASTVVALHLLMTETATLNNSLAVLSAAKPDISINPGFLCQLNFLDMIRSSRDNSRCDSLDIANLWAIRSALAFQYPLGGESTEKNPVTGDNDEDFLQKLVCCKACKGTLASDLSLISSSIAADEAVSPYVDDYWRQWIVSNSWRGKKLNTSPSSGVIIVRPPSWAANQVQQARKNNFINEQLQCPHCSSIVGSWEPVTLNVLSPYLPVDQFCFFQRSVLLQRKRK